ncbi:MAG: DUF3179 domain-containing protein [Phycisphaerales bacterium]|nr:DUF3179 domain-containing protein [Phycisphaerales bacterium]
MNAESRSVDSRPEFDPSDSRKTRMLDFRGGGWVLLLAVLISIGVVVWRVLTVWGPLTTAHAIGDGRNIATYQFTLAPATIPLDQLIPAGAWLRRDGMPTLDFPETRLGAEVDDQYLVPRRKLLHSDRVIGVVINGEARAYPIWVMTWHEIANDTVGDEAICVTYAPLSDGAVVFRRPETEQAGVAPGGDGHITFGISGLVYNSSPLIYDRVNAGSESLWSPLARKALIGPAVGSERNLDVLPSALTTWGVWLAAYPNTTVVAPDPARSRVYKRDAYSEYFGEERLRFPVEPLPPTGSRGLKSRVVATRQDDGTWVVDDADRVDALDLSRPRVWCFWFAWFAIGGR